MAGDDWKAKRTGYRMTGESGPEFHSYGTFTRWTSGRPSKLLEPSPCPGDRS